MLLCEDVDEFALKMMGAYSEHEFKNVSAEKLDIESDEDKATLESENEKNKEMLEIMKDAIGVFSVKLTNQLGSHPVSISTEGEVTFEME